MSSLLARNRLSIDQALSHSKKRRYFLPSVYAWTPLSCRGWRSTRRGECSTLDVELCRSAVLAELGVEYHSMDVEQRASCVHLVADLQEMALVPAGRFNTVLCSEVLEHVPRPERALTEIARVLRPGGKVLVIVPYLCRLHEEPRDYYSYTSHRLQFLLEGTGFRVAEIAPTGSVFSFLGHQVSTAVVVRLWHVPLLRQVAFSVNAVGCSLPCYWADRVLGSGRKLPLGYVAVAEKQV